MVPVLHLSLSVVFCQDFCQSHYEAVLSSLTPHNVAHTSLFSAASTFPA